MKEPRLNRISIILDEYNLDQIDLASILGVSKDTVSRWCRNANQPKLSDLYRIAQVFRLDLRRLIEPTEWLGETGLTIVEKYKENKKKNSTANPKLKHKIGKKRP